MSRMYIALTDLLISFIATLSLVQLALISACCLLLAVTPQTRPKGLFLMMSVLFRYN